MLTGSAIYPEANGTLGIWGDLGRAIPASVSDITEDNDIIHIIGNEQLPVAGRDWAVVDPPECLAYFRLSFQCCLPDLPLLGLTARR
jgi:hypothetical protein